MLEKFNKYEDSLNKEIDRIDSGYRASMSWISGINKFIGKNGCYWNEYTQIDKQDPTGKLLVFRMKDRYR